MKTSENRNFEEEWKSALEGAEIAPSDQLWNSIDLKLSHAERGEMKKRVVFYQRLAAASVLFALCLGAAGWFWNYDESSVKSLAIQPLKENQKENTSSSTATPDVSSISGTQPNGSIAAKANAQSGSSATVGQTLKLNGGIENGGNNNAIAGEPSNGKNLAALFSPDDKENVRLEDSGNSQKELTSVTSFVEEKKREVFLQTAGYSSAAIQLTGEPVAQIESARTFKVAKKEEKRSDERDGNWWASVNGSGGAYNQSSTSSSLAASLLPQGGAPSSLNSVPASKEVGVGTSFSYGMSVGKKIAKRWVVMGGVSYLNQSIDYNSNIVLTGPSQSKVFVADLANPSSSLASTAPYVLRNTNEFISIPVQAGYLLVNRKAGVQLNAGVAADIFYRNTMTDVSGKFGNFSQDAGDNSAYRNLNWTGLLGTEVSYKMNKHYSLSLLPGFRYSFNSVLKSSTGSTINPLVWDVGFRLKYVF